MSKPIKISRKTPFIMLKLAKYTTWNFFFHVREKEVFKIIFQKGTSAMLLTIKIFF